MAGSERSNSATADTRTADRTADKTQPPTAASEAPSADSHMPTEATASAATAGWTGFRCVGDRGNYEEQDRRGGNASHQASLGGVGRFQCRCARQRQEGLIVLLQIGSALRNAEMAHNPLPHAQRFVSRRNLSVHCDKRKEKDRLFVGAGRCRGVLQGAGDRRLFRWLTWFGLVARASSVCAPSPSVTAVHRRRKRR